MGTRKSGEKGYRFPNRYLFSPPVGNIDTLLRNGILIPHWWVKKIPFPKWVSEFPTKLNQWGKRIPFPKTVSIFLTKPRWWGKKIPFFRTVSILPTSGDKKYRFLNRYRNSPPRPTGGEKIYSFPKRYRNSPLVGKKNTVSQNSIEIPPQFLLVGKKNTVLLSGKKRYRNILQRYR